MDSIINIINIDGLNTYWKHASTYIQRSSKTKNKLVALCWRCLCGFRMNNKLAGEVQLHCTEMIAECFNNKLAVKLKKLYYEDSLSGKTLR